MISGEQKSYAEIVKNCRNFKICSKIPNFNKIPNKYTVKTHKKNFKKYFALHFLEVLHKKEGQNSTRHMIEDQTPHIQNKNLCQSRKIYTIAAGDAGDI